APAECASAALARPLPHSRIEASRLVAAPTRPAEPVLRRAYERATLRAARPHAGRARHPQPMTRGAGVLSALLPDPDGPRERDPGRKPISSSADLRLRRDGLKPDAADMPLLL